MGAESGAGGGGGVKYDNIVAAGGVTYRCLLLFSRTGI